MANNTRFVGLHVHAETIAVAVAVGRGQVRAGDNSESTGGGAAIDGQDGQAGRAAGLLRSGADGIRAVLAAEGDGHRL